MSFHGIYNFQSSIGTTIVVILPSSSSLCFDPAVLAAAEYNFSQSLNKKYQQR
jgi:hypothetical protein